MALDLEFLNPNDKPALLGLSTPEYLTAAKTALADLDYKVHAATNHEDFSARFVQVPYQVAVLEESFADGTLEENPALRNIQLMPMGLRRHAVIILIGNSFQSLHAMQAFRQSVHAVVNPADLHGLRQIIQQVVADTSLFFNMYRDTQTRIAQGQA
ncbi:MAG: hypothetical protein HY674_14300 [Chloroflexi bacterium]|nr:hypothetical protein [Chloroflexota bacterium]